MSYVLEESIQQRKNILKKLDCRDDFKTYITQYKNDNAVKLDLNIVKNVNQKLIKTYEHFTADESDYLLEIFNLPVFSYADHHGLLNFSLLLNSNILLQNLYENYRFFVVFATSNISMRNISYPRGFYYKQKKFNFFSYGKSNTLVSLFNEQIRADRKLGLESILGNYDKKSLSVEEKHFIEYLFFEQLRIEDLNEVNTYSDQISILNNRLWKLFFDDSIRKTIPDLYYVDSNEIITNIFLNYLEDDNSLICRILFEKETREIFIRNFENIQGCWGNNTGSVFFTGLTPSNMIDGLTYSEATNSLIGTNNNFKLEKIVIIDLLKDKKILLTLFFDFLILSFLGGYTTLGGFNQIEYLPAMQKAHVKSLREIGENDLADDFESRITDGLICGMTPLKFHSSIDMIWHYNSTDGKFNGNLDRGLTAAELDEIYNTPVRDMLIEAMDTIHGIVK